MSNLIIIASIEASLTESFKEAFIFFTFVAN